jgi:hypothetical protein
MKSGFVEKNKGLAPHRGKNSNSKPTPGKITDKYPVILDGGRTIIFVSDKKKEMEVRQRYESHQTKMPSEKLHS